LKLNIAKMSAALVSSRTAVFTTKINATRKVRASNVVVAAANQQQVRNQYIIYEKNGI
jgi:hypothetical protein